MRLNINKWCTKCKIQTAKLGFSFFQIDFRRFLPEYGNRSGFWVWCLGSGRPASETPARPPGETTRRDSGETRRDHTARPRRDQQHQILHLPRKTDVKSLKTRVLSSKTYAPGSAKASQSRAPATKGGTSHIASTAPAMSKVLHLP